MEDTIKMLDMMSRSSTHLVTKSSYNYDKNIVPRVTEVLSQMLHEEYIAQWANSLGFKHKGYRAALREASDKGTYTHNSIECFLKGKPVPDIENIPVMAKESVYNAYHSFLKWWDCIIANNKVEIIYSEKTICCKYFGGTLDCLLKINGQYWLIDFKTSNNLSYKYFLQLAAYRYILKEEYGIDISGCLVLMLSKDHIEYQEKLIDLSIPEHEQFMQNCIKEFMLLVAAFYGRSEVEYQYKEIFGGYRHG